MDYKYLNKVIDLGVEKAMRYHIFNNDEIDWYIFYSTVSGSGYRSGLV
jgi:hypothetical protein